MAEPTAEVQLIRQTPKRIRHRVEWRQQRHGRQLRWLLEAEVVALTTPDVLRLHGACNPAKWGFSLVWSNVPSRRLDRSRLSHRNPNGAIVGGDHQHLWHEVHQDREVDVGRDIDFTDLNAASFGFLTEWGIQLGSTYQPLMMD